MNFLLIYSSKLLHPAVQKQKFELKAPFFPPLGLLYIGRSLEDEGHHPEIIDFNKEKHPMKTLEKKLLSADVVGISVDNDSYNESSEIANFIRQKDPSIPIIIGGPHCTLYKEKSLRNLPAANVSVIGDGEITVKEVSWAIEGDKDLSEINGIYYRENDKIKVGKPPKLIEYLDGIPFPSRHLVDKYEYGKIGEQFFYRKPLTSIITTRGCPFRCRFCIRPLISFHTFRQRSAQNVIDELIEINEKYRSVMIGDDSFLVNKRCAHRILDGVIENNLNLDLLIGGSRVDLADINLYRKMKKAGVKHISYGIESGNQETLDYYNKNTTLNQIRKAVELADNVGFFTSGSFILGAPFETEKHIRKTINFACSLPLDIVTFYPLHYRHGSDLWKEAVRKGLISQWEHEVISDKNRGLGNFSSETLLNICTNEAKRFYFRPKYMVREILKAFRLKDFSLVRVGLYSIFNPVY
jgi:radical SAM superfamily enzyme YgiQ (UPF0313 family)